MNKLKSIVSNIFPKFPLLISLVLLISVEAFADDFDEIEGADIKTYKSVDGFDLKLNIFYPEGQLKKSYPAIIFFFGGGWTGGNVHQFHQHCLHFSRLGFVTIAANYRVKSRNSTTPYDAVEDAKSTIRWVRAHAKELHIKRKRIVAAGGSAGGHVAACTGIIREYDLQSEDLSVSSRPRALILFNPVINTMPEGYGYKKCGENAQSISPAHHVTNRLPPTLIFHGTADTTVPFQNVEDFKDSMLANNNVCYLIPYEDQKHGFFNYGRNENVFYEDTIKKMEDFLAEIKFLKR